MWTHYRNEHLVLFVAFSRAELESACSDKFEWLILVFSHFRTSEPRRTVPKEGTEQEFAARSQTDLWVYVVSVVGDRRLVAFELRKLHGRQRFSSAFHLPVTRLLAR